MSKSNVLTGFLAGAALGAVAGILLAPDKGSVTRKKISDKAGEYTGSVKDSVGHLIDGVKEKYSGAKQEVEKFGEKEKTNWNTAKTEINNA